MPPPLAKLAILLVDDNPNMITIMRMVLKGFGVNAIYDTDDIVGAFEAPRKHKIDIAFVDCNLGATSGLDLIRLIRSAADSTNPYLPIVMLTAYSEQSRVEAARDAGATDFLVKPVTPSEVYRKIIDIVERPRPFVRSDDFFGPDRRRHCDPDYEGPERRAAIASPAEALAATG